MKKEIVMFVNKLFITKEYEQSERYTPDTTFQFTRTDNNVSVERHVTYVKIN